MRNLYYAPLLLGLAVLVPLPYLASGEFKLEPGFSLLFNGKNLDGWQTKGKKDSLEGKTEAFKGRFKVDKGSIVIDYTMKGDSYIETTKVFGKDVTVRLDFKAGAGCNNDFFLRGTKFDIVLKGLKNVKEGEWSTLEISVKGDTVVHKINGDTVRTSKTKTASSPLMIRAEFGIIEIKNIRVME